MGIARLGANRPLSLPLLVLSVLADHAYDALAANDLTVATDLFYGGLDLHLLFLGISVLRAVSVTTGSTQRIVPRPPLKFAFFIKASYWWDIKCAWTCAIKSITTTTMIIKDVPPK